MNTNKDRISDLVKVIGDSVGRLKLLQEYNFNGPQGDSRPKDRLLDIGHDLVRASAEILRLAADLEG